MGNSQSVEVPPRAPQKLSKPKTGNHATAGLLSPGSFSSTSRRHSNAVLPSPPLPSSSLTAASTPTTASAAQASAEFDRCLGDNGSSSHPDPPPPKQSRRRSLFRSRSSRGVAGQSGGFGAGTVERLTRAPSMTYESAVACYGPASPESRPVQPDPRTSWNYNLTSYEAKRLLNLPEEPGPERARAMSDTRAPVVTETTWKSSNPADPPNAPITRSSSDVSLYMPVRRRSIIQTPGVATRSVSIQDNPLPQINFRHSHPASPCLSRQQSFESHRSGVMSMPPRLHDPDSVPRVATPCDEQYRSIGTFKLGSLRITNGSPAPASPEVSRDRGAERLGVGEGTAQDGYFLGAPLLGAGADSNCQNPDSSSSEPSQPQPTSPALQTTSKVTAQEDQLFDDEAQPEYSSVEVLDVRLDPSAKASHSQVERDRNSTVSRTDSGFESTTSPSSESAYRPLAKADSGYSSNVSLRSFHAKARSFENHSQTSDLRKQEPSRGNETSRYPEEIPPPVPPKDTPRRFPMVQPKSNIPAGQGTTARSLTEKRRTASPAARHVPAPIGNPLAGNEGPASPKSAPRTPGSVKSPKSSHPNPDANAAPGQQKPSRLQRFLSGTRRSTGQPAQAQYTPEHSTIPPLPQQAENKLHELPRALPARTKRLALRPHSSLDTLKTIFSVGSIDASLDAVNSVKTAPRATESEIKDTAWRQTLHGVPSSIANAAAHVIPRKPMSRKPVPVPQKSGSENNRSSSFTGSPSLEEFESANGSGARSQTLRERTQSLTLPRKQSMNLNLSSPTSTLDLASSAVDLPAPPVPSPVAKAMLKEADPARRPPINSTIRRPLSLRIPPPLRAQSSTASLSRKTSRESMRSYTTSQYPTRRSSVESFHSYSAAQPSIANGSVQSLSPTGPTMDPRRLQSFRKYQGSPSSPYGSSNWEAQQEQGGTRQITQPSLTGGSSRRNSISSVHTEGAYGTHRAGSAHGWQAGETVTHHPPLRHRASYDGYSYHHQQPHPRYGYPPSMSNGYTAPAVRPWPSSSASSSSSASLSSFPTYDPRSRGQLDAAATWSRSQRDAAAGQWYQDGGYHHYPPYVPRGGHYRNRSMGSSGGGGGGGGGRSGGYGPNAPPFRVLHSYNSPAYRGVPIWG